MRDVFEVLLGLLLAHRCQTLFELIDLNAHQKRLELGLFFVLSFQRLQVEVYLAVLFVQRGFIFGLRLFVILIGGLDEDFVGTFPCQVKSFEEG